jgi:hypothetical protein
VTVLARKLSQAQFPPSVRVARVDCESIPELTLALTGQDAVVSAVGPAGIMTQLPLIEASVAARVNQGGVRLERVHWLPHTSIATPRA